MKFKIQAGGEIDLLTKDELGGMLDEKIADFDRALSEGIEYYKSSYPLANIQNRGNDGIYAGGTYELGGPEPGYLWSIKNISYIGLNTVNPTNLLLNGSGNSDLLYQGLVNTGTALIGDNALIVKGGTKILAGAVAALTPSATIVLYYMQVPVRDIGKL